MYKLFVFADGRLCLNPREVAYWQTTVGVPPETFREEVVAKLRRMSLLSGLTFIENELENQPESTAWQRWTNEWIGSTIRGSFADVGFVRGP